MYSFSEGFEWLFAFRCYVDLFGVIGCQIRNLISIGDSAFNLLSILHLIGCHIEHIVLSTKASLKIGRFH
ncbi:unnamed protein product [Haemonchus placei]|uniref:Uncharacterized protein n=1 Tax=Haemonchus placei TaxID=6290 RepID=A0A3P7U636_HAEPC|nr:unnamed protein product [Haemonchus placei]